MKKRVFAILGFVLVVSLVNGFLKDGGRGPGQRSYALPTGGTMVVSGLAFTNQYRYLAPATDPLARLIRTILPKVIVDKTGLNRMGGGVSVSSDNDTISLAVEFKDMPGGAPQINPPPHLIVGDASGNYFRQRYASGMLSFGRDRTYLWQFGAFPRREKELTLSFVDASESGTKGQVFASFSIPNPDFTPEATQWIPVALPQERENTSVRLSLLEFQTGLMKAADGNLGQVELPYPERESKLTFSLIEAGRADASFALEGIEFEDATGNQWSARSTSRLEAFPEKGLELSTTVEHGLWESEVAWKVTASIYRDQNFTTEESWVVTPLTLPKADQSVDISQDHEFDGVKLTLGRLYAPGVETKDQWQWLIRYWGSETNVFPLTLEYPEDSPKRKVVVMGATNEKGEEAELVEVRDGGAKQALFFQLPEGSELLNLQLASPPILEFEYLASPSRGIE